MSVSVRPPAAIDYPDSDGKPMAENDWQHNVIVYAMGALKTRFAGRSDVYVSGDLFIYHEEGNPRASVVPDVFVVFGAERRLRRVYKLWEEPKAPDFVLEVASPNTWQEDEGPKRVLYERLGVREYFQHDPMGEHLPSRLQGRRLVRGAYEPLPAVPSLDGTLLLYSETLGLDLLADQSGKLRFRDPVTGEFLLSLKETEASRQGESAARRKAESRAETAEARAEAERAARQREEAARQTAEAARQREEAARQTAEAARQREEAAREQAEAARRAAEARVAELEALLALRRG